MRSFVETVLGPKSGKSTPFVLVSVAAPVEAAVLEIGSDSPVTSDQKDSSTSKMILFDVDFLNGDKFFVEKKIFLGNCVGGDVT